MSQKTQKKTYRKTLNLPKTVFGMKANLVQNEPGSQARWTKAGLYDQTRQREHPNGPFVFHDGPPYANGSIHLGHLLNKVLKDFVVRSKTMAGFDVPYVPGWDCHGLPIEHKVVQETGPDGAGATPMTSGKGLGDESDRGDDRLAVRRRCRKYAEKFVKVQKKQMQRLLTLADYDHPYLTMDPQYEAGVLEVFAELVGKGLVYRGLKPVHWSIENQTALADAELEYFDREDPSIYVLFEALNRDALVKQFKLEQLPNDSPIFYMIWTTTPWTLPANLAIAASRSAIYGAYRITFQNRDICVILAQDLAARVLSSGGVTNFQLIGGGVGRELERVGAYKHPFLDEMRRRLVVCADYVTLDDGTGLVHTAPGHGVEDYQTALRDGLEIYCPVQDDGTFDDSVPEWLRGKSVWDGNELVCERLRSSGNLFHEHRFTHSYPHDWRGKTPVIFRATEQWFVSVDRPFSGAEPNGRGSLRDRAMAVTRNDIAFIPEWGRNRMRGMLESRPDWCISRQRAWGLPIPAFFPPPGIDGDPLLTASSVRAVARTIRKHGSDCWFTMPAADLLRSYEPAVDTAAPVWLRNVCASPGGEGDLANLQKSTDIFDVWFESGSSWHAAVRQRFGDAAFPTDLYLEGSDQHRGWFQLSLLPALGLTGRPPFRAVLTHGFMVDKDGLKMSKSLGNALEVEDLMKKFGADVCRWWVSSLNTDNDSKVDHGFFELAGEEYRKVRNTVRFLLSNLGDFDPAADRYRLGGPDAASIDTWAAGQADQLIATVAAAYDQFQFRRAHDALFDFCNDTMSAVYLAAIKDRLYCDRADSPRRRRSQTVLYHIADTLIRLLGPIVPHTADEAWRVLHGEHAGSVHLELLSEPAAAEADPEWQAIMTARESWMKAIESARQDLGIDNPLDCGLRAPLWSDGADPQRFAPVDLADLCGISRFEFVPNLAEPQVDDLRGEPRCERSWKRDGTVRPRTDGGMLSDRDAEAIGLE